MKRAFLIALALAAVGLALAAGVSATGGEDRYMVAPSGQGAFVILDRQTGAWEHVATRPDAQGMLSLMRGSFGGDQVSGTEIPLKK